ncbi:innexin unc-9-like [Littorina saxatilis]|uniref:Innexin n=1 Tax=Littorina saxatilis TaxID=31220 RepID=A0AAN9AW50_9CAEN
MAAIQTTLSSLNNIALRSNIRNDDGVDQLHHFVTVAILAAFAAITGVVEYAGEPINCWNYGDYLWKHFQDHVNSYCWTHSMFQYPNRTDRSLMPYSLNNLGGPIDPTVHVRSEQLGEITFFRWVTIIFLVQAFCFKLPNLLWAEVNAYSGSNIIKMVEMLQGVLFAKLSEKKEKLQQVALFLEQWLRIHRKPHWFLKPGPSSVLKKTLSCCTICIGTNMSNYLSSLYLVTKFLFVLNNIMQFLILSAFLQINFWHFGVKTLNTYSTQQENRATTQTFPTVALCHFQTYDNKAALSTDGASGKWVQCILTINVFLEKLFLIEWFWLLLLLILTLVSFSFWCFKILQTQTALSFVRRYMRLMGVYAEPHPVPIGRSLEQFVTEYLGNDGVFVLRILAVNTNEVVIAELVEELWERYLKLNVSEHGMTPGIEEAETAFMKDDNSPEPVAL